MEIPDRQQLESAFARKLSRLNSRQRQRLRGYLGWPPDLSRVPPEFWREVEDETASEVAAALLLLYAASAEFHGAMGRAAAAEQVGLPQPSQPSRPATPAIDIGDIRSTAGRQEFDAAMRRQAEEFARQQAADVAKRLADTARERIARKTAEWQQRTAAGEKLTRTEVESELAKTIGPNQAARTATTQTTVAQTAGGDAAINRTVGVSDDDIWRIHPELSASGTCPVCRPLDGRPRRIWQARFPMGPPAHANCQCEILYSGLAAMVGA